ncbi:hypothetical protein FPV67DRAFT_1664694 [Lyophyllum atratum]|nr:hypothetical protein FPV67DRAFT_1664694 [Lyophyllum atratum]
MAKDTLGVTAGVLLPAGLVQQMSHLHNDLENWIQVYDLQELLVDDGDDRYKEITRLLEAKLTSGSLLSFHEAQGLRQRAISAHQMGTGFKRRFDSLMQDFSGTSSEAQRQLKDRHMQIICLQKAVQSEMYITDVAFRAWLQTSSSGLSKVLQEYINRLPVDWHKDDLEYDDIQRLSPETWLNDSLVDYFICHPSPPKDVLCLSPLFYTKYLSKELTDRAWEGAWKWRDNQIQKSIEFLRVILLPVNVNKSHWVLIHCDLERQVIRILDSLPSNYQKQIGNHNWLKSRHAKLVEGMRTLVQKLKKKFGCSRLNWNIKLFECYPHHKVPFQQNTNDCGVYVIIFARHLQSGLDVNHASLAPGERIPATVTNLDYFRLQLLNEVAPM